MNELATPLLLSLKPCHADLVFEGLKKAELRRRIASCIENRKVFVYVSSPTRALRGGFRVGQVWKGKPSNIWKTVSHLASVRKKDYDAYFAGCEIAVALEIRSVWEYKTPIRLSVLKKDLGKFIVPQSWRYLKEQEYGYLSSRNCDGECGPAFFQNRAAGSRT